MEVVEEGIIKVRVRVRLKEVLGDESAWRQIENEQRGLLEAKRAIRKAERRTRAIQTGVTEIIVKPELSEIEKSWKVKESGRVEA